MTFKAEVLFETQLLQSVHSTAAADDAAICRGSNTASWSCLALTRTRSTLSCSSAQRLVLELPLSLRLFGR